MKKNKLVLYTRIVSALCVLLLVALVAGCGGETSSTTTRTNNGYISATADIGDAGGTVTAQSAYGSVVLTVLPNALSSSTTITVTPIEVTALSPLLPITAQFLAAVEFEILPGTAILATGIPATVSFPLPIARAAGDTLYLLTYDETEQRWVPDGTATVSTGGLSATATLDDFSTRVLSSLPQGTTELTFSDQDSPGFGLSNYTVYKDTLAAPSGDVDFTLQIVNVAGTNTNQISPVGSGVLIKDMGAVNMWTVTEAPADSELSTAPCNLVSGHTYVIKTAEGRYGLIYCKSIAAASQSGSYDCVIDWAYQPAQTRTF